MEYKLLKSDNCNGNLQRGNQITETNYNHNDHDYSTVSDDIIDYLNSLDKNIYNSFSLLEQTVKVESTDQILEPNSKIKSNKTIENKSSRLLNIKMSKNSILDKFNNTQQRSFPPIKYKLHPKVRVKNNPTFKTVYILQNNESSCNDLPPKHSAIKSISTKTKKGDKKESDFNKPSIDSLVATAFTNVIDKQSIVKKTKQADQEFEKQKTVKQKNSSQIKKKKKATKAKAAKNVKSKGASKTINNNKKKAKRNDLNVIPIPHENTVESSNTAEVISSKASLSSLNHLRRNPFELVECKQFETDSAPFSVKLKCEILAIMDFHAHCMKTEVIGLLGGHYCKITKTLHVQAIEPCPSICDDSIRCEIDPVSQANALEKLEAKHYQVVGWYHSHPTFSPQPSKRDIETQKEYQAIFERCTNTPGGNGRPYVGFIFSPYMKPNEGLIKTQLKSDSSFKLFTPNNSCTNGKKFFASDKLYNYADYDLLQYRYFTPELNSVLASSYKCFWVSSNGSSNNGKMNHSIPYEIRLEISRDECLIPSITKNISPMCEWIAKDYSRSIVNLSKPFTRIGSIIVSNLEKIIASLSYHLQCRNYLCADYECERIRQECISILVEEFSRIK